MAISRYSYSTIVTDEETKKNRLSTFPTISSKDVIDDSDIIIRFDDSMRLDALAQQYLGDGRYWWAICIANDIHLPFGDSLPAGTLLRIPTSMTKFFDLIKERENQK